MLRSGRQGWVKGKKLPHMIVVVSAAMRGQSAIWPRIQVIWRLA
jgi:hypothetical protein